jgi:hypothetical protein
MSLKAVIISVVLAAATVINGPVFAADATIDQVYQAAEAGDFGKAQRMMDEVLRDHPASGRAHFVEAELLAKQGRLKEAAAQLRTAELLEPDLPFAKPQAVHELERRVGASSHSSDSSNSSNALAANGGFPWRTLMIGAALVILVLGAMRAMRRRNTQLGTGAVADPGDYPAAPRPANPPMPPYGGGAAPGALAPPAGAGIGSSIVGGLATGAALGAGLVAGEALAHRLGGASERETVPPEPAAAPSSSDDMGGNDFGISDGSSWDDAGGGGDSDSGSDWS